MGRAYNTHGKDETLFWSENLKGRCHLKDLGVDGRIIVECALGKYGGKVWTGFIWFRTGTSGGLF
jgi:hypothetical protein